MEKLSLLIVLIPTPKFPRLIMCWVQTWGNFCTEIFSVMLFEFDGFPLRYLSMKDSLQFQYANNIENTLLLARNKAVFKRLRAYVLNKLCMKSILP